MTKEGEPCGETGALKVVLVLVGLLFSAGVYPLIGSLLHPADSNTGDTMMLSLYVALGIFLLIAVRNPSAHRSLIAFAAWSSFAHAGQCRYWDSKSRFALGSSRSHIATSLRSSNSLENLAEASGSRTHRRRGDPPPAGFEDQGSHRTACASIQ